MLTTYQLSTKHTISPPGYDILLFVYGKCHGDQFPTKEREREREREKKSFNSCRKTLFLNDFQTLKFPEIKLF